MVPLRRDDSLFTLLAQPGRSFEAGRTMLLESRDPLMHPA